MIRAYDDSWSRKKDKASYVSPIGSYLHAYGNYCRDKESAKSFKYQLPESVSDDSKYTPLKNGRLAIQSFLKGMSKISNGKDDDKFDIPSLYEIISSSIIQTTLLKAEIPDFVENHIKSESDKNFEDLLLMVFFSNFILDRIAITIVTAKNEDYAFDMFESLNTTGEPLTAFETFKPRVIYFEGLESYKDSNSYKHIELTENYLESIKPKEKQDVTSRLIISFALAEQGIKMSKKLSDQRRFLKESYEELLNEEDKRSFVRHLSHIALFMENIWPIDKSAKSKVEFSDNDDLMLCLDFLRKLGHTITIGLIARFYSKVLSSKNEERLKAISDFIEIVKASVAFSVLWRASRIGTDAIDTVYRDLLLSGCAELGMAPLARTFNKDELPDINLVKKSLAFFLKEKGGIESKDDWIRKTSKQPVYKQPFIVRFILLSASHDSTIDKDNPGLLIKGKDGLLSVFNFRTWNDDSSQTVEHIAPQTRSNGWSDEIYEDTNTVDRLGNLTLLPISENSSLSNRDWMQKRLIYKILSSETIDDLNVLLNTAKHQNIEISQKTSDLLERSKYLPMLKSISNVESDWSLDIIEKRGNRMAGMAWQKIAPWLEI